jgi:hypothetical protein
MKQPNRRDVDGRLPQSGAPAIPCCT